MDDKTEVIRHNIEETRTSLTEKLETLEESVVGTVKNTTDAVTDTVDSVKGAVQETVEAVKETVADTVGTVRSTVHDTVEAVKGTVRNTVAAVKESVNISHHVQRYPWAMFGGSIAAGYLVGYLTAPGGKGSRRAADDAGEAGSATGYNYLGESVGRARANGAHGNGAHGQAESETARSSAKPSGFWGLLSGEFDKIRKIGIGAALGIVREVIDQNMSGDLAQHLTHLVDDFNQKLGGEPIRGPFFKAEAGADESSSQSERAMAGAMM